MYFIYYVLDIHSRYLLGTFENKYIRIHNNVQAHICTHTHKYAYESYRQIKLGGFFCFPGEFLNG